MAVVGGIQGDVAVFDSSDSLDQTKQPFQRLSDLIEPQDFEDRLAAMSVGACPRSLTRDG